MCFSDKLTEYPLSDRRVSTQTVGTLLKLWGHHTYEWGHVRRGVGHQL